MTGGMPSQKSAVAANQTTIGFNHDAQITKGSGAFPSGDSKDEISETAKAKPEASFSVTGFTQKLGALGATKTDGFA